MHAFAGAGLMLGEIDALIKKIERNRIAKARWKDTQVLIIDEISMVDADLFDRLEYIARTIRRNNEAFGGIQVSILI